MFLFFLSVHLSSFLPVCLTLLSAGRLSPSFLASGPVWHGWALPTTEHLSLPLPQRPACILPQSQGTE